MFKILSLQLFLMMFAVVTSTSTDSNNLNEDNYNILCFNQYFHPIYFSVNINECMYNKNLENLLKDKKKDDIQRIK